MRYRTAEDGPVLLRVGLGVVYFVHGVGKLLDVGPTAVGVSGFAGFLGQLGVPVPVLFAWVVALVETLGGLALLLGVLTRFAAALVAIAALSLVLTGPGALSFERILRGEEYLPERLRAPG